MSAQVIEQRDKALRTANRVRSRRARLKVALAAGDLTLSEVLMVDKQHLQTMHLRELLLAVPHLGSVKVERALRENGHPHFARLENVNFRRREVLLGWLRSHYKRVVV